MRNKIQNFYWSHVATPWQQANHNLRQVDRLFSDRVAAAEKAGNLKLAEELDSEWGTIGRADEQAEVDRLLSAYWEKRAARYYIPTPPYHEGGYWDARINLTTSGIDYLENRIYEKRKRKWEFWLAFAPAITGLIGAFIGLAAILKK